MNAVIDNFTLNIENQIYPYLNDVEDLKLIQGEVLIPFMGGRPSCGLFGISDDFIESYQSLDERFIKNKNQYVSF